MRRPPSLVVYRTRDSGIPFERVLLDRRDEDDVVGELSTDATVVRIVREDPPSDGYGLEPTATWDRRGDSLQRRPYRTGVLMVELDKGELAQVCRRFGVRRLAVFGSAITDDFDPVSSDVDVLVELKSGAERGMRLLDLERELSDRVFEKRPVDVSTYEGAEQSILISHAVEGALVVFDESGVEVG